MLKAVHAQRLRLIEKCEQLEADTEKDLARFSLLEEERAHAGARVEALEEALRDAIAARAALEEEQAALRIRLEHDAEVLTTWRCLVKRLHRTEAHLQGTQRACVVFVRESERLDVSDAAVHATPVSTTPPSASTPAQSSRFRLPTPKPAHDAVLSHASAEVSVLDPYSVCVSESSLCYNVDAVHPSRMPSSSASTTPSTGAPSALDEVLLAVACEAVEGVSCTVIAAGPSSADSQHRVLFQGRRGWTQAARVAPSWASEDGDASAMAGTGALVQVIASVLALARRESTQYRVRLSLAQLYPPHAGTAPVMDLLAGSGAPSARASQTDAATVFFIPLLDVPHWPPRDAAPSCDCAVSAVPISSVEEAEGLLARAWCRRDDLLGSQRENALSHSYASPSSSSAAVGARRACTTGGIVALLTVECVDIRGRCHRAVVRVVELPSSTLSAPSSLEKEASIVRGWRSWSEQARCALIAVSRVKRDPPTQPLDSAHDEGAASTACAALGPLGHFLRELYGKSGKAVLLCCCGYTSSSSSSQTMTTENEHTTNVARTFTGLSARLGEWLALAHHVCHAVYHCPSAQEPYCMPAEVLKLQESIGN